MAIAQTLTTTEVAALVDMDEGRARKEVEYGLFGAASPPRFSLADAVYLRALALLGVQLGVDDRVKLHDLIGKAMASPKLPAKVDLGPVLEMKLAPMADAVRERLARFETWKRKLVVDESILGGEPVFPKSRLAVRHIGGILLRGASLAEVREDYPYLKDENLEFAPVFVRAYPRMGRPRERQAAACSAGEHSRG
jgi:uncharacterized protein (DUF433 family)